MSSTNSLDPKSGKRPSFWARHISPFLSQKISARVKRMVFLSSVVGLLENITTPDKEMLEKLNAVLKLAHNQDAIALPIYVHSWLWKECDVNTCVEIDGQSVPLFKLLETKMSGEGFKKVAAYLMNIAPNWMVYGSEQVIAKDLELLFDNAPRLNR